MINRTFIWTLITLFFFTGIALGGYDLSGSTGAENLTATNPTVQSLETDTGNALADALAPQFRLPSQELSWHSTLARPRSRRIWKG